jgi:peptidoglycan/xylan/chitin deacetylase (PgdA/CDA1 family)
VSAGPWTPAQSRGLLTSPLLACNYHFILPENREAVEARLRRLVRFGTSLDLERDIGGGAGTGAPGAGPRIVVGFYDSYREAALFGADLCHRLGIRAYFFPVFEPFDEEGTADLTDAELADIAQVHEIGFHSSSHRSAAEITEETLVREVDEPVRRITELAGRPPLVGAWRGGARFDDSLLANRRIRELGVRYVMSNWSVEAVPTG